MGETTGPGGWIAEHFDGLTDPRVQGRCDHDLVDILVLTLCAVAAGADGWVAVEEFGHARLQWLRRFACLRNGIPSHDTLGRVFAVLDPQELSRSFSEWTLSFAKLTEGEVVAIDGKTARRSFREAGKRGALHMVSAWACGNGVTLGQVATEDKSNEIRAIPRLLELLDLHGTIVTIDAAGCQKAIAQQIRDGGADYVLALKGNQPTLEKEVSFHLTNATSEMWEGQRPSMLQTVDAEHGRIETRRYVVSGDFELGPLAHEWTGLRSVGMVESSREMGGDKTTEQRYFISSLGADAVEDFARAVRSHWQVENKLHWVLDVTFREDDSQVRTGHAQANFAVMRRHALNLLRQEKTLERGAATKQLKAALDPDYHERVMRGAAGATASPSSAPAGRRARRRRGSQERSDESSG